MIIIIIMQTGIAMTMRIDPMQVMVIIQLVLKQTDHKAVNSNNVSSKKYDPQGRQQDAHLVTGDFQANMDAVLCHTGPALQP